MQQKGTFKPGDVVGPYSIAGLLGVGFMGEVYQAAHRETGHILALKCLQVRHLDNADLVERARREAAALCSIRHANIVYVHEAGVTEGGIVWMAMELLSGRSLRRVIKEHSGGMPLSLALHYACEIADGVDAAHEQSIVHRDLKPENVHVTEKNEIRVLDLGTAKFFGHDMETTGRAQVFGTVPYMSPEHLAGERVDCRTDVYALGIMLYEMIAGVHPFKPYFESMLELGRAQLFQMPRPLFEVVPGLPGYVWSLVEKAVAKDRENRPVSMSEFARAIRRVRRRFEEESKTSADDGGVEVTLPRMGRTSVPDEGAHRGMNGGMNGSPSFRHLAQTLRIEAGSGGGERTSSPSQVPPEQPFATPPGGGSPKKLGPFGTQVIPAELRSAIVAAAPANAPPRVPSASYPDIPANAPPRVPSASYPDIPANAPPRVPSASYPDIPKAGPVAPLGTPWRETSALRPDIPRVVVAGPASVVQPVFVPVTSPPRETKDRGGAVRQPTPSIAPGEPKRDRWKAFLIPMSLVFLLCIGGFGYFQSRGSSVAEAGGLIAPPASASISAPVPAAPSVSAVVEAPESPTVAEPAPSAEPSPEPAPSAEPSGVSDSPAPSREPKQAEAASGPAKGAPQPSASGRSAGSAVKPISVKPAQTAKPKAPPSPPTKVEPLFDF